MRGSVASGRARRRCVAGGVLFALTSVPSHWRGAAAQQTQRTWVPGSWTVVTSLAANRNLLAAPGNLACSGSALYTYDYGDHALKALSLTGAPLWRVPDRAAFHADSAVVSRVEVSPNGDVWMTRPNMGHIAVFSPAGTPVRTFTGIRNIREVQVNRDGSFWAWRDLETMPELRDSAGALRRKLPSSARVQPVDWLTASGTLASGADGALAVAYTYSNRFLIVRRGGTSVHAFRGVGEPRTAPKLKGETLTIGARRITGFRPAPGTRIVAMAVSVDADHLYILRGDDSTASPQHDRTVDSYRMSDGSYTGSYLLPDAVEELCVHDGEFIATTAASPPALRVWRFAPGNVR